MRILSLITLVLLCAFVLSGCLEVQTTINVKRDGSGTVRELVIIKSDMLRMMMTVAKKMKNDDEDGKKNSELFDEKELREKAETMGEGVAYKSGKKISTDDGDGYEAVYVFKDINTLRVDQDPNIQPSSSSDEDDNKDKKEITFEFRKGSPATLIVHVPPTKRGMENEEETEEQEDEDTESGIEMARMMLKDLKISSVIEVQGTVVESDATFREKSKITLMDIDFGELLEDENLIRKAMKRNDISDEEAKELMKEYPGLKIELNRTTTVRFR